MSKLKIDIDEVKVNQLFQEYLRNLYKNPEIASNIRYLAPKDWLNTNLMVAAVVGTICKNPEVFIINTNEKYTEEEVLDILEGLKDIPRSQFKEEFLKKFRK